LDAAGGSDKGLFDSKTLSSTLWGWVEEVRGGVSESDRAPGHTARLRSRQVAGVGAGPESHGGGVDSSGRVRMGGDIVEEAVSGGEIKLGGVGLIGGELADGRKDGQVKGPGVEEQGPNHPLDPGLLRRRDRGW
jgi:hypothetical protein